MLSRHMSCGYLLSSLKQVPSAACQFFLANRIHDDTAYVAQWDGIAIRLRLFAVLDIVLVSIRTNCAVPEGQ